MADSSDSAWVARCGFTAGRHIHNSWLQGSVEDPRFRHGEAHSDGEEGKDDGGAAYSLRALSKHQPHIGK